MVQFEVQTYSFYLSPIAGIYQGQVFMFTKQFVIVFQLCSMNAYQAEGCYLDSIAFDSSFDFLLMALMRNLTPSLLTFLLILSDPYCPSINSTKQCRIKVNKSYNRAEYKQQQLLSHTKYSQSLINIDSHIFPYSLLTPWQNQQSLVIWCQQFPSELKIQQQPQMTAIFKGLFRWSLQITGASIIWYNYQTYEQQQKLLGIYQSFKNSYRFVACLYSINQDFKIYKQNQLNPESLKLFKTNTAKKLEELCERNLGAYARIGQILSNYTDIVPSEYTQTLKKLNSVSSEGLPYAEIKSALTSIYQKDTKELFDGFQTKPLKVGLFTQSHKAVLLQNYREVVVKVLLPSLKVLVEHDIWFINKVKDYVVEYLKKQNIKDESYSAYLQVINNAEDIIRSQINLELQLQNVGKNKELMYDSNSSFYVPYYFTKFCNQNVIIKQFVEGVSLNNLKGLKQLGVTPQVAYAYVLSQVHHLMKKFNKISGSLKQSNILIRKYIKPYKTQSTEAVSQEQERPKQNKTKQIPLAHPQFQVVFLSHNNFQQINNQAIDNITAYWNNLKKEKKKKILPSVSSFYQRLPKYKHQRLDVSLLLKQKYYLYEPLIKLYETISKKQ